MENDAAARACGAATSTSAQERFIFAAAKSSTAAAPTASNSGTPLRRHEGPGKERCRRSCCIARSGDTGFPRMDGFQPRALDLQGRHSIGAREHALSALHRAHQSTSALSALAGRCSFSSRSDLTGSPHSEAGTRSSLYSSSTCDSSSCLVCQRKGVSVDLQRKRSFADRGDLPPGALRPSHSVNDLVSLFAHPAPATSASDSSCSDDSDDMEMGVQSRRSRRKYSAEWMALSERSSADTQAWGERMETDGSASATPVRAQFSQVAALVAPGSEPMDAEERFVRAASTTHVVQELALSCSGAVLAGATRAKQVCLYDCRGAMVGEGGPAAPSLTHSMPSRVSSMSWSPHSENVLALGDTDGVLWQLDASTGHVIAEVDEHDGDRLWCVSHSFHHANIVATSAGNSGCVKLWDSSRSWEREAFQIVPESRVPVCSLAFSPHNDTLLAAASSDHHVYLYDLRNPTEPLQKLGFHSRPVSYVRFMGADRLVSSSVDGSVALWGSSPGGPPCVTRVFKDHVNRRNFAGLSVDTSGLIACGSEDGAAYAYFPAWEQRVAATVPRASRDCFVTSVAWLRPQQLGLPLEDCPPVLAVADTSGALNLHALIKYAGFQDPEDLP